MLKQVTTTMKTTGEIREGKKVVKMRVAGLCCNIIYFVQHSADDDDDDI